MESYWIFVTACVVLCITPGPDMVFLLSRTAASGKKAGMIAALGINTGGYFHLGAALIGISALLAASPAAFTALKWVGAAYLIWIGIQAVICKEKRIASSSQGTAARDNRQIFWQGFLSDVLNPKVALFFLAFLPQFVGRDSSHRALDILFLGITLNIIALIINIALVNSAAAITRRLSRDPVISVWINAAMGIVFILLGLRLLLERM